MKGPNTEIPVSTHVSSIDRVVKHRIGVIRIEYHLVELNHMRPYIQILVNIFLTTLFFFVKVSWCKASSKSRIYSQTKEKEEYTTK
jgi:hypothetical protein